VLGRRSVSHAVSVTVVGILGEGEEGQDPHEDPRPPTTTGAKLMGYAMMATATDVFGGGGGGNGGNGGCSLPLSDNDGSYTKDAITLHPFVVG
jgi:hypothetical protein